MVGMLIEKAMLSVCFIIISLSNMNSLRSAAPRPIIFHHLNSKKRINIRIPQRPKHNEFHE